MTQVINFDNSVVSDVTFQGSLVKRINLNGSEIWEYIPPVRNYVVHANGTSVSASQGDTDPKGYRYSIMFVWYPSSITTKHFFVKQAPDGSIVSTLSLGINTELGISKQYLRTFKYLPNGNVIICMSSNDKLIVVNTNTMTLTKVMLFDI